MSFKNSLVWNFFDIDVSDESKVKCIICEKLISRGGKRVKTFNTSNMMKHLKTSHKIEYEVADMEMTTSKKKKKKGQKRKLDDFDLSESAASPSDEPSTSEGLCLKSEKDGGDTDQPTLQETFELKKLWDINSTPAKPIDFLIAEMIALDNKPVSIVEDVGFTRLIKTLKPDYQIPDRWYFSNHIIPTIHKSVMEKVKSIVDSCQYISFTTDIWTSSSKDAFISFTGHCVSQDFEFQTVVLKVLPLPEPHTPVLIASTFREVVEEFNIPSFKIHSIVRDNGPNIVKGIEETGQDSLSCFLDTLQLIIKDYIFEQRKIKDIIANCQQIVTYFSHSDFEETELIQLQEQNNLPKHEPIENGPTRWNSVYLMLERIFEQQKAIEMYCGESSTLPSMDPNKWSLISKLCLLLKVFHKTTVQLSERESLVSDIIPQIQFLKFFLDKARKHSKFSGLRTTIRTLKETMERRFSVYLQNYNTIISTFLDPRYKTNFFLKNDDDENEQSLTSLKNIKIKIKEAMNKLTDMKETEIQIKSENESDADESEYDFDTWFNEIVNSLSKGTASKNSSKSTRSNYDIKLENDIESEVDRYLSMEELNKNDSPLQWWKANKHIFPILSNLAAKYLSSPPTSFESEGEFSIDGNFNSPHRNRLSAESDEMLVFLSFNLRIFDCEY